MVSLHKPAVGSNRNVGMKNLVIDLVKLFFGENLKRGKILATNLDTSLCENHQGSFFQDLLVEPMIRP